MPQPAAATAYGCGQPLPQYNLGSCAIPGMVAQQQYWMPTFAQQPPLGILPARQGSSASCGTGFGSTPAAARQATTHDALWRQQPPTPQMAHLPGLGMPPGYPGFLPPGILPPGNAYHACGGAAHAPCYPSFAMPNGGGPTGLPPQAAWTLPNAVPQAAWAAPAWIPGCHMAAPPAAGSYCQPAPSSAVPGGSMPPAPTAPANAPEPISKVKDASTPEVAALKHVAGLRRDALPALLSRFHRDLSRKHPKIREALGHTTYTIGAAMQGDTELGEANAYIAKFIDTCLDGDSAHVAAFRQRYEGDPRLLYDGVYLMEQIAKLYQITHGSAEAKIAKKEFNNAVFFTMGMDLAKTRENGLRLIKQFESVPGLFTGPIDTWHAIIDKMPSALKDDQKSLRREIDRWQDGHSVQPWTSREALIDNIARLLLGQESGGLEASAAEEQSARNAEAAEQRALEAAAAEAARRKARLPEQLNVRPCPVGGEKLCPGGHAGGGSACPRRCPKCVAALSDDPKIKVIAKACPGVRGKNGEGCVVTSGKDVPKTIPCPQGKLPGYLRAFLVAANAKQLQMPGHKASARRLLASVVAPGLPPSPFSSPLPLAPLGRGERTPPGSPPLSGGQSSQPTRPTQSAVAPTSPSRTYAASAATYPQPYGLLPISAACSSSPSPPRA